MKFERNRTWECGAREQEQGLNHADEKREATHGCKTWCTAEVLSRIGGRVKGLESKEISSCDSDGMVRASQMPAVDFSQKSSQIAIYS
jgi:hypothetical protein